MFFPRLRRSAKWVFLALALVFGVGFVAFGVGSDVQSGIGDIFRGSGAAIDQPSVSEAREEIERSPKSAKGYRDLATALQLEGRSEESIAPLERLVELRPKDQSALRELAGLHLTKAGRLREEAIAAQVEVQEASAGTLFTPTLTTKSGPVLQQDSVTAALSTRANERLNVAYTAMQEGYTRATEVYKKLVAVAPGDPQAQLELAQAAQAAGDAQTAIAAYKRFLKLAPDDPSAPIVKEQIKQLEASLKAQPNPAAASG
jgi:tetratricopeptide (TPR) repeat protein